MRVTSFFPGLAFAALLIGCGNKKSNEQASVQTTDSLPPQHSAAPVLPEPSKSHIVFSDVIGWPDGVMPAAPAGFTVTRFADKLDNPRQIYVSPEGDVFVALSNTEKGIKGKVRDAVVGKAKSENTTKSANEIVLFRKGDPNQKSSVLKGLNQPFGMLVLGNYFFVANTDGLWRFPYKTGDITITSKGEKILELPAGGYNNHWTRNLLSAKDGSKIYVTVGSGSNVAEHGIANEVRRANILQINPDGSGEKVYASGLRNPVGISWSSSGELWAAVNERDELGDELVPDYITGVKEGGFYGWPYSYYGQHVDERIKPEDRKPDLVASALVPDVPLESHSASLGLTFYHEGNFPAKYKEGAFIGQHGSWNRSALAGYKVMFVPFSNGKPSGPPEEFLTGFIADAEKHKVHGRPVGVAITQDGALLVADDASNTIWKVTAQQ